MKQIHDTGLPEIDDVHGSSDKEPSDDEIFAQKVKPMPKALKLGLMVLPLVLIAAVVALNNLNGSGDEIHIGLDGEVLEETHSLVQSNDPDSLSSTVKNKSIKPQSEVNPDKSESGQLRLTTSPMAKLEERMASLFLQIQDMNHVINRIEGQGVVVNQLRTQISGIDKQLKRVPVREELERRTN